MPETRYARSGDVMVAYQVVGQGPFDVVIAPPWVSHVELGWEIAGWTALLRGLAEHARVLLFDKRGTGLSDRVAGVPTLEERSDDIRAVMEAAGSERAAVFGASEAVPMSVVFAASHPERVSALVLYGGFARTLWAPDYRFGATEREARKTIEEDLEAFVTPGGLEALTREVLPSVDEKEVRAWARMFRYGASPGSLEALDRMNMAIDVREVLPLVSALTLVLRQRADPEVRAEHGHYLAQHIPGATYVELDGEYAHDHRCHRAAAASPGGALPAGRGLTGGAGARKGAGDGPVFRHCRLDRAGGRTWRRAMAGAAGRPPWAGPRTTGPVPRRGTRHRRGRVLRPLRRARPGNPLRTGDPRHDARHRRAGAPGPACR